MTKPLEALIASTKQLSSLMVERFSMNPISSKIINEAWRKEFPDEAAIAGRFNSLIAALEQSQEMAVHFREQRDEEERKAISNFEECSEMSARIEELESQRKLAFTTSNRWADKCRDAEKRIAELEGYKTAYMEWSDKTDWVQKSPAGRFGFISLGMHLADVMTRHIEQLEASQLAVKLPDGLIEAVKFYEQVQRENPAVETGAWKDATDWILKEAILAAGITVQGGE